MSDRWCQVCCTRHELGPQCPGELVATDTERFGWRISVRTGVGREDYGVLIARTEWQWRARILTFPNMLWSVPGGRGTVKFVGSSAKEVEDLAREFILEHCRHRGYKKAAEGEAVMAVPLPSEGSAAAGHTDSTRYLQAIEVRFGEDRATERASTADLSEDGMFVVTNRPLPKGRRLKLVLELEHATLPLTGTVAWVRMTPADGRQAGMGVQLISPPALYRYFVKGLS